ncbi:hypothetical protein LWI29_006804 [Acer saccharum]|uniref:ZF-HD dimerization-type domain-containing protein n=1 Tax=Acer saccharum TaxID=4024 RepID=A0AA39VQP0_ACESA|nr:hypothetical protein LWI29_006804 [Acer saccharum]
MELSSHQEATGEIPIPIPIPINSAFSHHHMIHHHDPTPHHIIPASNNNNNGQQNVISSSNLDDDDDDDDDDQDQGHHHVNNNNNNNNHNVVPYNNKKMVRYKECLKNHAASMGGNATDGCGEFMPSGEEGTIEALNCSACNCHRNFHRKEIEGEPYSDNVNNCSSLLYPHHQQQQHHHHHHSSLNRIGSRKVILGHPHKSILPPEALGYPTRATPHQMIMSYNIGGGAGSVPSESDEMEDVVVGGGGSGGGGGGVVRPMVLHHHNHHQQQVLHSKKRHRTKFSQEQKDKMLNFAEKVGWKIQKQEESVVQQFCQEIGVKRRVLKVWMHNNKHNLAKKSPNHPLPLPLPHPPPPPSTTTA